MLDEARLERLLGAYFDQTLTVEEKRELELMLLSSSRCRAIFREYAELHGLTREWALRRNSEDVLNLAVGTGRGLRPAAPRPSLRFFRGAAAIAAGLVLSLAAYWFFKPAPESPAAAQNAGAERRASGTPSFGKVALLAQAIGVEWEKGGPVLPTGAALAPGWLRINSGTLGLDFYSGARVFLEGPAAIELLSPNEARLEKGKLTARVSSPAEGFTVHRGELKIVDRGTEFAVHASGPDDCEVHVFDGEVALHGNVPETVSPALFQGDAVSISGGIWKAISADRGSFMDPVAFSRAEERELEDRLNAWQQASEAFRATPDLRVYFNFEAMGRSNRHVSNLALGAEPDTYGTVIGGELCNGRLPGKTALGFATTSDRVRFRVQGETSAFTLMAWVRVDSLPLEHNALLSMSPDRVGEIHWKVDKAGRLLLGLRAENRFAFSAWERLESPPIFREEDFGTWMHLATVVDGKQGYMKHVVNGREVARTSIRRIESIPFGVADLGNFSSKNPFFADPNQPTGIRHFTGRIDEFALIARALEVEEIDAMR